MAANLENGILAIDIGSGTQDILVWRQGVAVENCPKMILPSPTTLLAKLIRRATEHRQHIFLKGNTMGGGPCGAAARAHIKAGLRVFALEKAALTFNDNPEKVVRMGIEIVPSMPDVEPLVELEMRDVQLDSIRDILERFEVPLPETILIAVQDHGYSPNASNRIRRFQMWKRALEQGDGLYHLLFSSPPENMTRMRAVKESAPNAWIMDTGAAAIIGACLDPWIQKRMEQGIVILNIGNEHVLAALVKGTRTLGIYEHHTSLMTPAKLIDHLNRFRKGSLTNEEIFEDMGHGCFVHPEAAKLSDFDYIGITGPNRSLYNIPGGHMAAPFGDMMLTGCFGLIHSFEIKVLQGKGNGRDQETN